MTTSTSPGGFGCGDQTSAEPPSCSLDGFSVSYGVSPTVFRARGYRFFFFSREEERPHVHVYHADGEAKFWLEPVAVAGNFSLSEVRLNEAARLLQEHLDEVKDAWRKHFAG
jgi:hypothetical protein